MTQTQPTVEELYRGIGRMVVRLYGRTPGACCVVASHAILGCSGLDSVFLNCGVVFGDGADGDDPAEGRLREFVARIRERYGDTGWMFIPNTLHLDTLYCSEDLAGQLANHPRCVDSGSPMPLAFRNGRLALF